ncbi:MAG: hypothetical protein NVS2B7_26230 [Herpetosiphon sp.]
MEAAAAVGLDSGQITVRSEDQIVRLPLPSTWPVNAPLEPLLFAVAAALAIGRPQSAVTESLAQLQPGLPGDPSSV